MNYFLQAIKERYAQFTGRARRAEYWQFVLVNFVISFGLSRIDRMMNIQILSSIYSLAVLVPSIAVTVRRIHDGGKSGWFVLIPFYNIYLLIIEGTRGPNEYGPDPKGAVGDAASASIV